MTTEQDLGALIGRYPSDNSRRRWIFAVGTPLGAVAGLCGILMIAAFAGGETTAPVILPGLVAGLGIGAMITSLIQGWHALTRADEAFLLYEGGLVHTYGGKSRAIRWEEIKKVHDEGRGNPLYGAVGRGTCYRVRLYPGPGSRRALLITSITEGAESLGEIVRQAAMDGTRPKPSSADV